MKTERKRKNIDLRPDTLEYLTIGAAERGVNLKRFIEDELLIVAERIRQGNKSGTVKAS